MRAFLIAGFLYLFGVAMVLMTKPTIMFTGEGYWKEFGIGRNPATHTWMPFWLFSILWALVSYIVALLLLAMIGGVHKQSASYPNTDIHVEMPSSTQIQNNSVPKGRLPKGYYILNTSSMEESGGVPNYIYLGKALPDD